MPENATLYFESCSKGDMELLRRLLVNDPSLVRAERTDAWTGLHEAAKRGHADAVRLLLEYGADPNARERGDNTCPLHWAAAERHMEIMRALLDAGGDVHGRGDVHELDAIGWATFYHPHGSAPGDNPEAAALLVERGARHHIFSAMSLGDLALIRKVVTGNPEALGRRMSRFEQGQTPLHFALDRKRYDILDLLIELGADLEAKDQSGNTPLEVATLRRDREAMDRLQAAGAKQPKPIEAPVSRASFRSGMAKMADSVNKGVPMIYVPDVARALDWYVSAGFTELARYEEDGVVNFGMVSFGKAELMLNMHGTPGSHDVSLWFYTDNVDGVYQLVKSRRLESAMSGEPAEHAGFEMEQDIEDMFYGVRQFGIRDLNGYVLDFIQSNER